MDADSKRVRSPGGAAWRRMEDGSWSSLRWDAVAGDGVWRLKWYWGGKVGPEAYGSAWEAIVASDGIVPEEAEPPFRLRS